MWQPDGSSVREEAGVARQRTVNRHAGARIRGTEPDAGVPEAPGINFTKFCQFWPTFGQFFHRLRLQIRDSNANEWMSRSTAVHEDFLVLTTRCTPTMGAAFLPTSAARPA